jgi:hypothetical protein
MSIRSLTHPDSFLTNSFSFFCVLGVLSLLAGCTRQISQRDAAHIASVVHSYSENFAIGPRGHTEWAIGDSAEQRSDLGRMMAWRRQIFEKEHLQVDSVSSDPRLAELKKTLHSILSKDEQSMDIHSSFVPCLVELDNAVGLRATRRADSSLSRYKSLFTKYNELYNQLVAEAEKYNKMAASLKLPDTINVIHFDKVTYKEIVDWLYILSDSTKKLILSLK